MQKNIALLAGGYTGEYQISVQTAITIENNIDINKYKVYKIIIDKQDWLYTSPEGEHISVDRRDFSLNIQGKKISFDAIFIAVHGTPGEDGKIQGYLEMLGIPFSSCNAIVSGLTFNKIFCNRVVQQSGLVHVSKSIHIVKKNGYHIPTILQQIKLPAFIKPAEGGSSLATTKVKIADEIDAALKSVFEFDDQAMIEEFVKGREVSIGVYTKQGKTLALPITEIISSKEFFDFEAKYTPGVSEEVTPANLANEMALEISNKAIGIYELLNCRGVCRVDFIIEEESNHVYFLEINTVPGQSENSIVPQQVRASGNTLMQFYGDLLEETLKNGRQ